MERYVAKLESNDIRRYAILGAEQRLAQLAEESEQILRAFPELRGRRSGRGRSGRAQASSAGPESPAQGAGRRRRRVISPEGRKRISDAQKARWARQRGEAQASAAGASSGGRKKK